MMQRALFKDDSRTATRQPKTDRLILGRYLKEAADDWRLDEGAIEAAHAILLRWADLEATGRLAELHETELQGVFLSEVFGQALGYSSVTEGADVWHLDQHYTIGSQTPDAVLGEFRQGVERRPLAVIELKGPKTHLDRDRAVGRTAVDQCWDYLVNTPATCRWGIVSNMVSFRLYERDSTKRAYEHFTLQSLRYADEFRRFYVLLHRKGLIEGTAGEPPRAVSLLRKTQNRQREVSDALYSAYSQRRTELISHLHHDLDHPVDQAIEYVQRLFDRIIFIAFCEDRGLLGEGSIKSAYEKLPPSFAQVTNPRWQNFKALFRYVDQGSPTGEFRGYNGGLFENSAVDDLKLNDEWTQFFYFVGDFDFADEVNLDVLGHLFERSITELEKLKASGLFGGSAARAAEYATMPQSAKRKQLGIYYTPAELTSRIVQYTVDELVEERFKDLAVEMGVSKADAERGVVPQTETYWRGCLDILRRLKVVDPACGSGAFLFQAYDVLEQRYLEVIGHLEECGAADAEELSAQVARFILNDNLYGVDLSPEAVEITQLALWIRSATPGQTLATLSRNIVHGNSLVHDPAVHEFGFDWRERFPEVFAGDGPVVSVAEGVSPHFPKAENRDRPRPTREPGFDCVIGNPPWERIKLQEREFFSLPAPEIATATNAAKRRKLVAKLESDDPELYERYEQALASADALLTYCRTSDSYPLTGKGDINTYAVFAELAYQLVAPHGRVGLLTPSGIASDKTTKDFFAAIAESSRLIRLFDFENRTKTFFPEVDNRFNFCILNFGGSAYSDPSPGPSLKERGKRRAADFVFFAHSMDDLEEPQRHIALSGDDIRLLNPNTRTCPIFRTRQDAEIAKAIYRRVPALMDENREGPTGNPWGIKFRRMFDQTNDAELFREAETLKEEGFKLKGNRWVNGKQTYLPLYEGKMIQMCDHRAAGIVTDQANWVRQGQTEATTVTKWQNPEYLAMPRFWVQSTDVEQQLGGTHAHFFAYKGVTSPTNQRTMIAALVPFAGVVNSAPPVFSSGSRRRECCLLANANSLIYDYVMRQKISNVHLNFFIVEQVPTLTPDTYDKRCPWDRKATLERWISERELKLTCTAVDMLPLAEACEFAAGSFQAEYGGRLNKWDDQERAQLMAELDAAYFLLYGIERDDAEYILSTFRGIHDRSRILAGGKSTAENILEMYDELARRSAR
ncbi:MAG: hypothetical protein IT427_18365 [Pirellulales bacterium]|nr:hypothetical protein [Pirellulales bacterium]